jgi:mRNA interferase YafQ
MRSAAPHAEEVGQCVPSRGRNYTKKISGVRRGEKDPDAIITELPLVIAALAADLPLSAKYDDHHLEGKWKDYREGHIKADFLLIYHKQTTGKLFLARFGSHSELFGK